MQQYNFKEAKQEYEKLQEEYKSRGYEWPVQGIKLIGDMYLDQYSLFMSGTGPYDLANLKMQTLSKFLDKAMNIFDTRPDGELKFSFINGLPTSETAEFFNLRDENGEYVNFEKTSILRLPENFNFGVSNLFNYSLTRDSEEISLKHTDQMILEQGEQQ